MKILLMTLNSKYIHSNLALRYLFGYAQKKLPKNVVLEMKEYTINQEVNDILKDLILNQYTHIFVSAYIWNIEPLNLLFSNFRRLNQKSKIIFGGPEVSHDAHSKLNSHDFLDAIIVGEGERVFSDCIGLIAQGDFLDRPVSGLVYKKNGLIVDGGNAILIDPLDEIPFPYRSLEALDHRVIYYESTRGCPFNCSYCLSAATKNVRYFSLNRVFDDLGFFLKHKVSQVKFVDRTFNLKKTHSIPILEFLVENDNGITNFHFEITADLLDEEYFNVIEKARDGLFQFEIGVQTTNPMTLEAINRPMDFELLKKNTLKLLSIGNAHIHLDLIAGLPYETYDRFLKSFDDVFKIGAHHLQLGFLKVLKGTPIEKELEKHEYAISIQAPYEVLRNRYISYEEMCNLKSMEHVLELYYNSGRFTHTLNFLLGFFEDKPSELFMRLAALWETIEGAVSGYKLYEILFDFAQLVLPKYKEQIRDILKLDYYYSKNKGQKPLFHYQNDEHFNAKRLNVMRNQAWLKEIVPHYHGNTGKQILKTVEFISVRYDIISLIEKNSLDLEHKDTILLIDHLGQSKVYTVPEAIWEGQNE